ncbi:unnamed protein product [Rotaria sordida]|uniref:Uncharacterized protein n=1 Tax=Rotaria sordida TaxID=392033 RepID=A0A819A0J4_9BILA|nr:unnamed protein product [Rotaria sordida]CAF3777223.1 unnamed protein product [Rotaria sordida]
MCRAHNYVRKNRKYLGIKTHTDSPLFINEERVTFNGLALLAEDEVDNVIMAHYGTQFGCGTRILHQILEARIAKVTKASSAHGQTHAVFSNKEPRKIIQAKEVFERLQVDLVDLSRRSVSKNGTNFRYALVILDIFLQYLFSHPLNSKSSNIGIGLKHSCIDSEAS